jgi:IclR family pca regulon transcriptional regulator
MRNTLGVGSRLPVYCTSMGRILLAGLPDDEIVNRLKASDRQARTRHTVTDLDELMAKIRQVRKQGWCLVNQELEEGLMSLAAPITNRAGRTIAAINISGQANRTNAKEAQDKLLPALLHSAYRISQMLP